MSVDNNEKLPQRKGLLFGGTGHLTHGDRMSKLLNNGNIPSYTAECIQIVRPCELRPERTWA